MRSVLLAAALLLSTGAASGQEIPGPVQAPVLTVDSERLLADSLFGVQLDQSVTAEAEALSAENATIEAELEAEELALTELRPSLSPEEFRSRADQFDSKVQEIRAAQAAKAREITNRQTAGKKVFLQRITPVLAAIARERGALIVLERQQVFLSAESIDITLEAIRRIDSSMAQDGERTGDEPAVDQSPVEQP
jgi:Skp family chaperone for outer membrane proteins